MAGRQPYETAATSYEESRIEKGEKFGARLDVNIPATPSAYYIKVTTGNKAVEMFSRGYNAVTSGTQGMDIDFDLYEDCPDWSGGTAVDIFADNRDLVKANTVSFIGGVSGGTLGTELKNRASQLRTERRISNAGIDDSSRYRMKKNTTYILLIQNFGNAAVDLRMLWAWFELLRG